MEKIKLRQIIDNDGRRPDPERATTIKDIPAPENVSSLQSLLGLANYFKRTSEKSQGMGMDTWMPWSIRQNKRSLYVGLVSHLL